MPKRKEQHNEGHKDKADGCVCLKFVEVLGYAMDIIESRIPPGPRFIPMNWVINFQKFGCWIFVLTLMIIYNNYSIGAWIYLVLHGSYGMCWFLKDLIFPDSTFQTKVTLPSAVVLIIVLGLYLLPGYQMATGIADNNPSLERICVAFFSYLFGLFLMIGADLQKYYTLKYRKGLIDFGFFKMTRNPNYLGEVLIYNSFAIIVNRWEFWIVLGVIDLALFLPRMLIKDLSLRKKTGWKEYDSYMFFPKFSSSCVDNFIIYTVFATLCYTIYVSGGFVEFTKEAQHIWATQDTSSL
jgi:protein-S-isoprenylcysteine O-methyltransferase Ste14